MSRFSDVLEAQDAFLSPVVAGDRIIDLEVKLDEQKSAMEKLAKEREEQARYGSQYECVMGGAYA